MGGVHDDGERYEQSQIQSRSDGKLHIQFIATVNAGAIFKITQLLPPEGDEFQYRIRNASEPYERVAKESQLNRAA